MREPRLAALAAVLLLLTSTVPVADAQPIHPPDVAKGFTIEPLISNVTFPSAINWGPGDGDGPDLYATMLPVERPGKVVRYKLTWTAAGPVVDGRSTVASGFNKPLGIAFDGDVAYVSDSYHSEEAGRTLGVVHRIDDGGGRTAVVDKLPNGAHNTNHLRFGPDGQLYIANGNPNQNGQTGGPPDVFPYSGAILSVDASFVSEHPQVLEWTDEDGERIPANRIADHPVNADFAENVTVVAHGFRNSFGVAFGPDDRPWTAMNAFTTPDAVYRIRRGTNYSFPFCVDSGRPGAVGDAIEKVPSPVYDGASCAGEPTADALLGHHVGSTGLDFPRDGPWAFPQRGSGNFRRSVYIGQSGPFDYFNWPFDVLADPARDQHNTGHKVARVVLDAGGEPKKVRDFVDGLALPTDVRFGPQGAMYIADMGALVLPFGLGVPLPGTIYRVAPAPLPGGPVQAATGNGG